jgi:hypothetical protein
MNHDHPVMTAGSGITEMETMWFLMVLMFGWNLLMAYQHYRLKNKVDCSCKEKK